MISKFKNNSLLTLLLVTYIFINKNVFAQKAQSEFGKNRVQYHSFDWHYITSENFEIYYYYEGEAIAPIALTYAEDALKRIQTSLNYSPSNKTKILLYNSIADLQQSNIGLQQGTMVGGSTKLVKSTVEVAFVGDYQKLRNDLIYGIARTWIYKIMYGGSIKEVIQSSYFLSLPEWYINGAALFIAEGWSREMDNYMRDAILSKSLSNPTTYSGREAALIGQSIWHYATLRYGPDFLPSCLQLTHVYRNERSGLEAMLSKYYTDFLFEWKKYYEVLAQPYQEAFLALKLNENRLGNYNTNRKNLHDVKWNKEGSKCLYVSNNKGKYKVFVYDPIKNKKKVVYSGGYKISDQKPLLDNPIVSWKDNQTIGIVVQKRGKLFLIIKSLSNAKKETKYIELFHQITSLSFNEDGSVIAYSADEKGKSDIWIYDLKRAKYTQVTNDEYDDHNPCWNNKGQLIFSSDRSDDTLTYTKYQMERTYSLFVYTSNSKILKRYAVPKSNLIEPEWVDANNVLCISDEKGIRNVINYNIKTGEYYFVTQSALDVNQFSYNGSKQLLTTVMLQKSTSKLFVFKNTNWKQQVDSLPSTEQYKFYLQTYITVLEPTKKPKVTPKKPIEASDPDYIELDSVYFVSDTTKKLKSKAPIGLITKKSPPKRRIFSAYGPYDYKYLFGTDNVSTTMQVDPLRGFGINLESNMSDLMSNHRVNLGIFLILDFQSSSLFGEYQYLKHRVDFGVKMERITYYASSSDFYQKYVMNKLTTTISYPFSPYTRISISPQFITNRFTELSDNISLFLVPDQLEKYIGNATELVYDNTTTFGMNMMEGTRAKVLLENYKNTSNNERNFSNFIIDVRHYRRIHRGLTLALRGTFGTSFGKASKKFLLGGMDNWLGNSTGNGGESNPLAMSNGVSNMDVLFLKYATNMRGFKYNTQSGPNYLIINTELRLPIIQYLYSGTVSSPFWRNLQIIGFYDFGAAWTGQSPFSTNNNLNTKNIQSNSFQATVKNYRNPFLYSYGVGVRTMFLGYYSKFDVAWGTQDNKELSPRFYFTFGYDF